MNDYVKVPASFAKKQWEKLNEIYHWLQKEQGVTKNASINTKIIDYCQCVIDMRELDLKL